MRPLQSTPNQSGAFVILMDITAIQEDLNKPNEYIKDTSALKFQTDKYNILHLGQDILMKELKLDLQEKTHQTTTWTMSAVCPCGNED